MTAAVAVVTRIVSLIHKVARLKFMSDEPPSGMPSDKMSEIGQVRRDGTACTILDLAGAGSDWPPEWPPETFRVFELFL